MKLPPHIKGLIFDCDGTLADTMPLHWHAWQIVTQRHNLHFPEDRFYSLRRRAVARHFENARAGTGPLARPHRRRARKGRGLSAAHGAGRADSRRRGNCAGESRQNSDGRRVRRHAANHCAGAGAFENPAFVRRRRDERNGEKPESPRRIFFWKPRGASASSRNSAAPTRTPILA